MSEWKPIETAPKDGRDILVYAEIATVPVVHIAFYRSLEEWENSGKYSDFSDDKDEFIGWWSYTRNSVAQEKLEDYAHPTHWMPLPKPPTGENDD